MIEEERKGRRNTKVQEKEGEKIVEILSRNIARLKNKNEDFWKYIEQFDIVGFQDTWLDKKYWEVIEGRLPIEYIRWLNTRDGITSREETCDK